MGRMPNALLVILFLGIHSVSSSDILRRQKRNWIIDSFKIEEEKPFPYTLGKIEVEKNYLALKLKGQGVDQPPVNLLEMDNTGVIRVIGRVDYETHKIFKLSFEAFDSQRQVIDTKLGVEVAILDINDNHPTFKRQTYEINIEESAPQGTSLITVIASDDDDSKTNNGTFDLRIVSVTPKPNDVEFYITQNDYTGTIRFKGCLDHEKAEKYTILVEAKDRGEKIKLSSTCTVIFNIEDGNNHLPVFTGQTGRGSVKEGEENVIVLRLQVSDQDAEGTAAWRAKYKILGGTNNNFRISTDNKTNEGVLYVEKQLDYEEASVKNMLVSVENEAPYYSCKVGSRSTSGLWDVVTTGGVSGTGLAPPPLNTYQVTVNVEDINEPPIFNPTVKAVMVEENTAAGHYLETFTAKDLDGSTTNTLVYMKGEDPGDWVKVDSKTCRITTTKILDRESTFVKDNIYKVTVYAVDKGQPPLTGTGTLNIHLKDQNDNAPNLIVNFMDLCLSDAPSLAKITAFDLDEDPYGGPFRFKLLGDVEGKWRLDPAHGYSVNLVKENTVHAGHHELLLQVFDLQGQSSFHNLSITVCNCDTMETTPNCRLQRATGTKMGGGAIGIVFIAMLLLLGILLLVFLLSCKSEKKFILGESSGEHLIKFNTETPGTDCSVPVQSINQVDSQPVQTILKISDTSTKKHTATHESISKSKSMRSFKTYSEYCAYQQQSSSRLNQRGDSVRRSMGKSQGHPDILMYQQWSQTGGHYDKWNSISTTSKINSSWGGEAYRLSSEALLDVLGQRMNTLQAPGEELGDYAPYPYAEEGDPETNSQLDPIFIPETPFDTDMLLYLGPRFNTLASICRPDADTS